MAPAADRHAVLADLVATTPGVLPRLRPHAHALLAGTTGLDRLRLHHVLLGGTLGAGDALLVRQALLDGEAGAAEALREDRSLARALAEDRLLLAALRGADPDLAAAVEAAARDGLGGEGASVDPVWAEQVAGAVDAAIDGLVAAAGRSLWGYRDVGPLVLDVLAAARARFRDAAVAPQITGGGVEQRVAGAFALVAEGYAARAGSVLALLDLVEDPGTRRRVAQLLGRETDGIAVARAQLSATATATGADGEALVERVGRLGRSLAEAVQVGSPQQALHLAAAFRKGVTNASRAQARLWLRSYADNLAGTDQAAWMRRNEEHLASLAPGARPDAPQDRVAFEALLQQQYRATGRAWAEAA